MVLDKKLNVSMSLVGTDGNLSAIGSFQIIQDTITELMGAMKIDGGTVREKYNAIWVFTKTRTKFVKKIGWNNELTITSYISFISNAKIHINVVIKDVNRDIILFSKTELCALNIDSQRIMKTSEVGVEESMFASVNEAIDVTFTKFAETNLSIVDTVKVKSTNIDFAHHTNNSEYIRLIMDTYSVKEIEDRPIKEFEIIYANQSFENDVLDIKRASFVYKELVMIEKNGKPIVKCEIIFNSEKTNNLTKY